MNDFNDSILTFEALSKPKLPPFFPVSPTKLFLLSVCSFGLYELYWFYKNWRLIQVRELLDVNPFLRAFFAFFFCYQVFTRIRDYPTKARANEKLLAGFLTTAWVVTTLTWRLPDPFWMISILAGVFMVPVQIAAQAINSEIAPDFDQNKRFSAANWIVLGIGGTLILLTILGMHKEGVL